MLEMRKNKIKYVNNITVYNLIRMVFSVLNNLNKNITFQKFLFV